jgi:RNA polymerase sigma-70 factor (ECF subfamily)
MRVNKGLAGRRCEQALKRLAKGDTGALSEIYDCVGRQMFAVAYTTLGDYQLAEDAVQDSFLKISKHAGDWKQEGSGRAWIMRIVSNTALNILRSRQFELYPGEFGEELSSEQQKGLSADSLALQEALMLLDAQDRQIVLLKAVVGLSHKEIARILDISLTSCQKRYQRNLKKLKDQLLDGAL